MNPAQPPNLPPNPPGPGPQIDLSNVTFFNRAASVTGTSSVLAPGQSPFASTDSIIKVIPRLAMSVEALDKCGKTHWALMTAPDPIAVVTNDPGTSIILEKALAAGRKIPIILEQEWDKADRNIIGKDQIRAEDQSQARKEWDRFRGAMSWLADGSPEAKGIRTVVIDQGTDLNYLCEQAVFGKLRGNARIDLRADMNDAMTRWFTQLYHERKELNIIIIHRLKKQYVGPKDASVWTGDYDRQGFAQMGYMVDMSVRCHWDSVRRDFYTELDPKQNTRFGANQLGRKFYTRPMTMMVDSSGRPEEESGFATLAMNIFPETVMTPEWWGVR